jgi:hypothetical protein
MAEIVELFVRSNGDPSVGTPCSLGRITILFHNRKEGETTEQETKELCTLFSKLSGGLCCFYEDVSNYERPKQIEQSCNLQEEGKNSNNKTVYVEGGTHLGIKGCYGVRAFQFPKSITDLPLAISEIIRKENKDLEHAPIGTYIQNKQFFVLLVLNKKLYSNLEL